MSTYPIPTGVVTPCADDPELMFAERKSAPTKLSRAKTVCNTGDGGAPCRYRDGCLMWALTRGEEGVWGGTDEKERRALANRLGIVQVRPPLMPSSRKLNGAGPATHPGGTAVGVEKHRKRYEDLCDACAEYDEQRSA